MQITYARPRLENNFLPKKPRKCLEYEEKKQRFLSPLFSCKIPLWKKDNVSDTGKKDTARMQMQTQEI